MFELERVPHTKKFIFKLGRGERTEIGTPKFDKLYRSTVDVLRIIPSPDYSKRNLRDLWDVYQGLQAMKTDSKLIKLKVVNGMVQQQVYEPRQLELPPEDELTPPGTDEAKAE